MEILIRDFIHSRYRALIHKRISSAYLFASFYLSQRNLKFALQTFLQALEKKKKNAFDIYFEKVFIFYLPFFASYRRARYLTCLNDFIANRSIK